MSTSETEAAILEAALIEIGVEVEARFGLAGENWIEADEQFSDARDRLGNGGADPGPIAVIDMGGATAHAKIPQGRIIPQGNLANPSQSAHAMEVAGIITSSCEATVHLYNVFDENGLNQQALYDALDDVAERRTPVLNMSIGSPNDDGEVAARIRTCIARGVTVVAAVGEGYDVPIYPAAYDSVIAVAGVDPHDNTIEESNRGPHVFMAAPGQGITVLQDGDSLRRQDGSSYAAPIVSAAVWLALRHVARDRIHEVLRMSVKRPGAQRNDQVGFGPLDLNRLALGAGV